jgi:hypothetical protein
MSHPVQVIAFASLKGGVGKSTLAVASAIQRARDGEQVLLVDGDLTGTSLADALEFLAPGPTGAVLSREQTVGLRRSRRADLIAKREPGAPYFFNDVLAAPRSTSMEHSSDASTQRPPLPQTLWRLEGVPSLAVLPSSSVPEDFEGAINWLQDPGATLDFRLAQWLIDVRAAWPELGCVVVDLPPGIFGFAKLALKGLAHLVGQLDLGADYPPALPQHFAFQPLLVTSEEPQDLFQSIEAFFEMRPTVPALSLLVNRRRRDRGEGIARVNALLEPSSPNLVSAWPRRLHAVDELDGLRELFWQKKLEPAPSVRFSLDGAGLLGGKPW